MKKCSEDACFKCGDPSHHARDCTSKMVVPEARKESKAAFKHGTGREYTQNRTLEFINRVKCNAEAPEPPFQLLCSEIGRLGQIVYDWTNELADLKESSDISVDFHDLQQKLKRVEAFRTKLKLEQENMRALVSCKFGLKWEPGDRSEDSIQASKIATMQTLHRSCNDTSYALMVSLKSALFVDDAFVKAEFFVNNFSRLVVVAKNSGRPQLSAIFNVVLEHLYDCFGNRVTNTDQWWFTKDHFKIYAHAIKEKGCPLDGCIGFIDGTLHHTCRPVYHQKEAYSGHKRAHGLKYQSVVLPNGLIANLYGPEPGRRHDSFILHKSGILEVLKEKLGAERMYLYGDSGYPLRKHLITPFGGGNLSEEKLNFNEEMSKVRISVEWEFGALFDQFAFLNYKYSQKIFLQPVAKYMVVAAFLKNCKTCLYGSQTSSYFNLNPPSLESYVKNQQ